MKKTALLLVIVLVLTMALSSCDVIWRVIEPKDAEALWERVDKKMSGLDSFRVDFEADVSFEYMGSEVKGDISVTMITIGDENDENPYFYNRTKTKMSIDGSSIEDSDKLIAYDEGKMYVCENADDKYSRIYSALTPEEFDEYSKSDGSVVNLTPEDAKVRDMEKLEGGEWSLSFSKFDKDALDELIESLGFNAIRDNMGVDITDASVKLVTDEKFRIAEMTVELLSGSSKDPFVSMTACYSEYNAAEKIEIEKPQYREVDDVRVATWTYDYLNGVINREDVSFDLAIEQKVEKGSNVLSSYSETDQINFKNKNGSFTYSIGAKVSGQDVSIEYGFGTQTIHAGGKTQTNAQSTIEANAFIMSLMNVAGYKPLLVENITKTGNNLYTINLTIHDLTEYKNLMSSLGDKYKSNTTYIIVEMDGEDVKSIKTYIEIKGSTYTYVATSKMTVNAD